jgi:hypothetical protein
MIHFYNEKKVKQIRLKNEANELISSYNIDTSGQVFEGTRNNGPITFYYKTVQLPEGNKLEINQRWRGDHLQKSDSIFHYYREYKSGDTLIYHNYTVRIIHIQGSIINERNAYFNDKYLGKPNNQAMLLSPASYVIYDLKGGKANRNYIHEIPNYFDSAFKTNYETDKIYLAEYSILRTGGCNIGDKEYPQEKVYEHSNFKDLPISDNKIYFVDGEEFNEPAPVSFYNCYPYYGCAGQFHNDGYGNYYQGNYFYPATPRKENGFILRVSDGLLESSYCDYYEFDDSPEAQLLIAQQDSLEAARIEDYKKNQPDSLAFYSSYPAIVTSPYGNQKRRIQKFKERKTAYCYEYEFYDNSSFP